MREDADSPDSDDSFGFARRKSNFVEIENGPSWKKSYSGDEEYGKEAMSRIAPATIVHSRYGRPEPPSLLMGLSDTAANLMLSSSDEDVEGEGRPGKNLLGTSTKEALFALNTALQLPQRYAQSGNPSNRRTRPLSPQHYSSVSMAVNGFSTVSLSAPNGKETALKVEEPKQGETEGNSKHTAFQVSPKAQQDTYPQNSQPEQLENQDVVKDLKTSTITPQKMEETGCESGNSQILNDESRLLRRRIIDLEGVVEHLKQQIEADMERHKSVQTSQKEEHESSVSHLKELHQKEVDSLRQQLNDTSSLQSLAEKVEVSANSVKLLKAQVAEAHTSNEFSRAAQLDARERLISDLEGSARKTQEIARGETVRLQGVLGSVDTIVEMLHGQNAEDRNTLRHEANRLESLRVSLLPEVAGLRKELEEEHARLAKRWIALEEESRRRMADFSSREQRCQEQSAQLKREQVAFIDQQASARASAEKITRVHCEEKERLSEAYSRLQKESSCFEERVKEASKELRDAEHARAEIEHNRQSIEADRRKLSDLSKAVSEASEQVSSRIREAEHKLAASESIKAEAKALSQLARETMTQAEEKAYKAEQVYRQNEMDHVSITKALVDAQHERGEAHRLRIELQERKQKVLEGPHSVIRSGHKSPVNREGSISSNVFSLVNHRLQSQSLVTQTQSPSMPSRHDIELDLNILGHNLDESAKYLSAEEVFVKAYTVEDPIIGVME